VDDFDWHAPRTLYPWQLKAPHSHRSRSSRRRSAGGVTRGPCTATTRTGRAEGADIAAERQLVYDEEYDLNRFPGGRFAFSLQHANRPVLEEAGFSRERGFDSS
jgi:hypothetical protein